MEDCDYFLGNRFHIRFRKPVQKTSNKLNFSNKSNLTKGKGEREHVGIFSKMWVYIYH